MKKPSVIEVESVVTPSSEPGHRLKVEPRSPEAKTLATPEKIHSKKELMIQIVGLVLVSTIASLRRR